jgi:hypothetical protein
MRTPSLAEHANLLANHAKHSAARIRVAFATSNSRTAASPANKQSEKAYATGDDKGKSDDVKQQYWLYVSMQRQRNQVANVRLYPV